MKKMFIVMIVVAMAVGAACGKKKAPAGPTGPGSADPAGSAAAPAEGSGTAPAGETPPPAN